MSTVNFNLTAESRNDQGKGASRRLRHLGKIPAIIYGGDKDPQNITLDHDKLMHNLDHESFYSHILEISVDGAREKVVLKDLQRHPAKPTLLHADFLRIDNTHKIRMQVPIHFSGEEVAPGVKVGGGLITHNMSDVEISCFAKDLPEFIAADLSTLELDHSLHLSDLQLPEGVEIVALTHGEDHDLPVATIHKSRVVSDDEEGESPAAAEASAE